MKVTFKLEVFLVVWACLLSKYLFKLCQETLHRVSEKK